MHTYMAHACMHVCVHISMALLWVWAMSHAVTVYSTQVLASRVLALLQVLAGRLRMQMEASVSRVETRG